MVAIMYNDAIKISNKLLSNPNKNNLKLYGFIVSIKDNFIYKNTDCTEGFIMNINLPYNYHSKLIKHLGKNGAIITCKGNVP